jgi:hypothetical protein
MKKLFILLFALVAFASSAQVFDLKNSLSPYALTDTVTNGGTATVTSPVVSAAPAVTTTIWVVATKISGTVGGTITLQGSLDGTNWKALNTPNTATALATFTATDATNTYHWVISGSPFRYYRVSWTGTGTMAATLAAQMFRSK